MGSDIKQCPTSGDFFAQAPGEGLVIADVTGAIIAPSEGENAPQKTRPGQLFGPSDGRKEAKVKAHLGFHASLFCSLDHSLPFGHIRGQGLFAIYVLACLGSSGNDLLVLMIGHTAVNHVDVIADQQFTVIGRPDGTANFAGGCLGGFRTGGGHAYNINGVGGQRKVKGDISVGHDVNPSNPTIADHCNAEFLHGWVASW